MYKTRTFIVFEGIEGSGKSTHALSLIKKLKSLINSENRKKLGETGKQFVQDNFSVEKMASNYYNLFIGCD